MMATGSTTVWRGVESTASANGAVVLLGRFLFVLTVLTAGPNHFSKPAIGYAASRGVPLASIAVPRSGVIALLGALGILLGYRAKPGGWLIVLFLVPVTLMMHKFRGVTDPKAAQMQMVMFMKNTSMLGGALLITQWGSGPFSLDVHSAH
jgi:putative oxidoreductase